MARRYLRTSLVQQRKPVQRAPEERNRQSVVQRLFQLRARSARQHIYSDRAAQSQVLFAEVARLQRPVSVQPRQLEHAACTKRSPGLLRRSNHLGLQHGGQLRRTPGGTRRPPTSPPRFTSTTNSGWSRRFASAISVSRETFLDPGIDYFNCGQSRCGLAAEPIATFPPTILLTLFQLAGRHHQRNQRQHDRSEHEAERFPVAVRRVAGLWPARRIRLEPKHQSSREIATRARWATSTTRTTRIEATASDYR